jgi:hypothetical protein
VLPLSAGERVPTEFAATVVIAGLDPAIHRLRKTFFEE